MTVASESKEYTNAAVLLGLKLASLLSSQLVINRSNPCAHQKIDHENMVYIQFH